MTSEAGTLIHTSATKEWLKQNVRKFGVTDVLAGVAAQTTTADALQMIDDDPREYFVLGACDNQTPEGRCAGHRAQLEG